MAITMSAVIGKILHLFSWALASGKLDFKASGRLQIITRDSETTIKYSEDFYKDIIKKRTKMYGGVN
jgi:hypothetical protein